MIANLNIHPDEKWDSIEVFLYGPGSGKCILFKLIDRTQDLPSSTGIAMHYGKRRYYPAFVESLKRQIAQLPDRLPEEAEYD